jgi:EpsI family protein
VKYINMLIRAVALFVVFVAASGVIARAQRSEPAPPRQTFSALPMTIDKWRGRNDPPLTDKELEILGADDYILRSYFAPGTSAGLYMGYWATQTRGDAVHSPLNCLPGSGWEPLSRRPFRIALRHANASRPEIEVNRFVIQKGLDRQLVLYWYQSHGRVVASEYWGKFYLVADAIRTSRSDTAIVRVVVPIRDASPAAEAAAERDAVEFVQQIFPTLDDYIPS